MASDELVAQFISMMGVGADEARSYLEMAGGELQQAVNLFLEMGAAPAPRPQAPSSRPAQSAVADPAVAAEVAAAAAAAGIETGPIPDADMGDAWQDEVRAPIPAFQDQIINPDVERRRIQERIAADTAAMHQRMAFDRPADQETADDSAGGGGAGSQAINQLFATPAYNEGQPYYQTIEKAKAAGKWILVNIQQAEVFASHTLNRDVWSDETVRDVVGEHFLFWQRDDKSHEGQQFCQYYSCGHQLPHICVVDPRTGRRVKGWDGRKWTEPHAAAEYLYGFLDQFSMSRSPPAGSPSSSPTMKPQEVPPEVEPPMEDDVEIVGLDEDMQVSQPEAPPAEAVALMPPEPAETEEHLKVSFRLPNGTRVQRRFPPAGQLELMFQAASALAEKPPSSIDLSTQFPKRSLRDVEGGMQVLLKDAQVAGNVITVTLR